MHPRRALGEFELRGIDVDRKDERCSGGARNGYGHESDRADPGDSDALHADTRGHDGVHGVAERIEDGGELIGNRRIEPPDVVFRNRNVFGEGAVAIDADDLHALADMRVAGAAEQTGEVDDVPFGRDALAHANASHGIADCRDRAHELMPDDERRLDAILRPCVPGVNVMVGSAEAGLFDANQDVGRTDRRNRHLHQAKTRTRARFDERHHRRSHDGAGISLERARTPAQPRRAF